MHTLSLSLSLSRWLFLPLRATGKADKPPGQRTQPQHTSALNEGQPIIRYHQEDRCAARTTALLKATYCHIHPGSLYGPASYSTGAVKRARTEPCCHRGPPSARTRLTQHNQNTGYHLSRALSLYIYIHIVNNVNISTTISRNSIPDILDLLLSIIEYNCHVPS